MEKLFKKLLANAWEYKSMRSLMRKFNLYGNYKQIYHWPEYKRLEEHRALFQPLKQKLNPEWYKYFTLIRQEEDPAYMPEDIWHIEIEPRLNDRSYAKGFNDKNLFDSREYRELFPKTIIHIIKYICYDRNYEFLSDEEANKILGGTSDFVIKKAIDSGGGKGVAFINSGEKLTVNQLRQKYGGNIIIQEQVKQHSWFNQFNPSSINTIRVVTYRRVTNEEVVVLQTLLRVGKAGSRVDNQSSGGIAIGIDTEGKLNTWGCDKLSEKFDNINGVKLSEVNNVPSFTKLKEVCIAIARKRLHERILVFDTWQDQEGNIRLVEINNINIGIEDLQKNNGPLFGKYTKEVIGFCTENRKNYCFDFEL